MPVPPTDRGQQCVNQTKSTCMFAWRENPATHTIIQPVHLQKRTLNLTPRSGIRQAPDPQGSGYRLLLAGGSWAPPPLAAWHRQGNREIN
jgi:hypothetical protein